MGFYYVSQKTPNTHGRIRLSIVDNYYDKVKKCSRQKTVESIGWLDELEKQYDSNTIMKMLVYSRLLFPVSKKSSYDNRERFFENTDYSLDDVYRCLSFLDKHRENLQVWMNDRIKKNYGRDTSLIYYDVTNYYFETDEQNDFLRKGVCKEPRPNPIVQMGLFIDNKGIPITYELFPGNTNDCLTYRPNLGLIKKQFDLGRVITVADKEMTTGDNIWYTINTPTHDGYVFSMSIRGAEKSLKNYVLKEDEYEWLGTEYKRKSRKCPRTIQVTSVTGKKINPKPPDHLRRFIILTMHSTSFLSS